MATRWKLTHTETAIRTQVRVQRRRRHRRCLRQALTDMIRETASTAAESDAALALVDFERTFRDFVYEDPRFNSKKAKSAGRLLDRFDLAA